MAVPNDGVRVAQGIPDLKERAYALSPGHFEVLRSGSTMVANLNLTYRYGGFVFAEPGEYDVTALLLFYDSLNEGELIVRSDALRIRAAHSESLEEERDVVRLVQHDVGTYIAPRRPRGAWRRRRPR